MKFGLEIEKNNNKSKLVARFGGIGKFISDSIIMRDIFFIEDILSQIKNICLNKVGKLRIQSHDYSYLIVHDDFTMAYFYNEFDDEKSEIEMGKIDTIDLIIIFEKFIGVLRKENDLLMKRLDPLILALDKFVDSKKSKIKHYTKSLLEIDLTLAIGNEVIRDIFIMKGYKLRLLNDTIQLSKNRQYENDLPLNFTLNTHGIEKLISYLDLDLEQWYKEKMKMRYAGNKLIVEPDEG